MARLKSTKLQQPLTTTQRLGSRIKSARDIMRKDKGLNGDLDRLPMFTWVMFLKFLDDMEQIEESKAKMRGERSRPAVEAPYRWRDWATQPDGITGPELLAFVNQDEAMRPDGKRGPGLLSYLRGLQGGTETRTARRRRVIATVFKDITCRMLSGYLLRDVINKVHGIRFLAQEELFTLGHLYETMLHEGARHAMRALALSYPRDRWFVRSGMWLENARRARKSGFRTFIHPPAKMQQVIERAGFKLARRRTTPVWTVNVFVH